MSIKYAIRGTLNMEIAPSGIWEAIFKPSLF